METVNGKQVSVLGAARSGLAAAAALTRRGARVRLVDSKTREQMGAVRWAEIAATGAEFAPAATVDVALPPGTELVVTSPGVPATSPILMAARLHGIPVWSEIELAYRLTEAPLVAVTGTNGKTTTTLLIAAMLQTAGIPNRIGGNVSADEIKRTLVEAAEEVFEEWTTSPLAPDRRYPVLVAEVSSFQLEWVEQFRPVVGILTNVTPDHLNRHATFDEYVQTKARLFAAQEPEDWAILNYDDPAARRVGEGPLPGCRVWFTRAAAPPDGGPAAWVDNGMLTFRLEAGVPPLSLMSAQELPPSLPGTHNVENLLAAALAALHLGAPPERVREAICRFQGVAHRMEFVAEIEGVRYINNSMCTNTAAGISSLMAMDRPTLLIAGGADKGLDFAPLVPALHRKAKQVILIGQAANTLEAAFRAGGYDRIVRAKTLEEAIRQAQERAVPGDAVLLAPCCASFDMFADFEARGHAFRKEVAALAARS